LGRVGEGRAVTGDEEFEEPLDEDIENLLRGPMPEPIPEGSAGFLTSEIENLRPRTLEEKEVQVMGVYEHQEEGRPPAASVLLRDITGRQVIIWIGRFEAYAISASLEGVSYDRPMTHDLLKSIVDRLGGTVDRIRIDDLWQDTYYAKMAVTRNGETIEIDCRPSDAIAVALRAKCPIYMAESVLQQASKSEEI
jgi:uncharacterized protein